MNLSHLSMLVSQSVLLTSAAGKTIKIVIYIQHAIPKRHDLGKFDRSCLSWSEMVQHRSHSGLISLISVLQAPMYLRTLWCCFFEIILSSLYLVEGLVRWDWLFTWWAEWLTNCCPSVLDTVGWVRKNRPQYDL